jgi:FtsH-binding integral membrane protein
LGAFDEPMTRSMVHIWAWFGACMAWVLGHWVIQYLFLPQIALILTILGYGLATLYYLDKKEKLKAIIKRQLIGVMGLLLLIIIVFSDWQDKTV